MVPRLVPEILSKCAFCDEAVAVAGIGDSRSLIDKYKYKCSYKCKYNMDTGQANIQIKALV